jgi:dolichyl-phosphate-mannose-protein mannosyltransferase
MVLLLVLWGFIFWLPVFIGLPLSPGALKQRWWLQSWI